MKTIISSLTLAAFAVVVVFGTLPALAGNGATSVVTGSGHLDSILDSDGNDAGKRTFTVNAVEHKDGSVTGKITLSNKVFGTAHANLNCFRRLDDGTVFVAGVFTKPKDMAGSYAFAFVRDGGKDGDDEISPLFISENDQFAIFGVPDVDTYPDFCSWLIDVLPTLNEIFGIDLLDDVLLASLEPIDSGNITVR